MIKTNFINTVCINIVLLLAVNTHNAFAMHSLYCSEANDIVDYAADDLDDLMHLAFNDSYSPVHISIQVSGTYNDCVNILILSLYHNSLVLSAKHIKRK